jgi:hypothetical protein
LQGFLVLQSGELTLETLQRLKEREVKAGSNE